MIAHGRMVRAFASQGIALVSQEDCERLGLFLVACLGCGKVARASLDEPKGGISSTLCEPCFERSEHAH